MSTAPATKPAHARALTPPHPRPWRPGLLPREDGLAAGARPQIDDGLPGPALRVLQRGPAAERRAEDPLERRPRRGGAPTAARAARRDGRPAAGPARAGWPRTGPRPRRNRPTAPRRPPAGHSAHAPGS